MLVQQLITQTANTLLLTGDGTIDTVVTSNTITIKVQDGGVGTTQLAMVELQMQN